MSRPTDRDGDLLYEDVVGYMNEVAALAEHFQVPGVSFDPEFSTSVNVEYATFTRAIEYRAVQIRARRARRDRRNSVALGISRWSGVPRGSAKVDVHYQADCL